MTCNLILEWIDDYLEGTLDPQYRGAFEKHLSECNACRMLVEDIKCVKEVMGEMPLMPLPADFNETLHQKLIVAAEEVKNNLNKGSKENKENRRGPLNFPRTRKQITQFVSVAAVIALMVASGYQLKDQLWWQQANNQEMAYDMTNAGGPLNTPPMPTEKSAAADSAGTSPEANFGVASSTVDNNAKVDVTANRELIRSGDISLKIANYDDFNLSIEAILNQTGGYIESSYNGMSPYYKNNRLAGTQLMGSFVLRIPSDQFKMVFEAVKKMGELQSGQQNVQDVTMQMADLKATLSNLKARETRLRELLSQAKNVTEVMEVERELGAVRTQIDQLESSLKGQQQQVSLSTLYINVQVSPELGNQFEKIDGNLFERAKQAMVKNINAGIRLLEMLFIGFVAWLPLLIMVVLSCFGISKTKSYKKWRHKND